MQILCSSNKLWEFKQLTNNDIRLGNIFKQVNDLIINHTVNKASIVEADANLIIDLIWLGNMRAAHDLKFVTTKCIRHIINITKNVPNIFMNINYLTLPINDIEVCYNNYFPMMNKGAALINKIVSEKIPILVHCKRGHHRSAAVLALYFMKYHKMSLIDAIKLIKYVRPTTFQRITCMLQVLIYYEYFRS